jgi:hypothetical protein
VTISVRIEQYQIEIEEFLKVIKAKYIIVNTKSHLILEGFSEQNCATFQLTFHTGWIITLNFVQKRAKLRIDQQILKERAVNLTKVL